MKILIVSGFLGSGKTSFIKAMAKATGRSFVIVENEFADLNIDANILLEESKQNRTEEEEMKIWELSEGCICCSLNLDFTHSVLTIANTLDPDYLIVEPSGVAYPSRIIKQLNKLSYERIELLAPITIVDGINYTTSKKQFPDYFNDQIKTAGHIVVSKSENFSAEDFFKIKEDLHLASPIEFSENHYSHWDTTAWIALLQKKMIVQTTDKDDFIPQFRMITEPEKTPLENISITTTYLNNPVQLVYILQMFTKGFVGKVVRAKGYLKIGNFWYRFDLVEGQYVISGYQEMPDTRVVVIGQQLYRDGIKSLFNGNF